MRAYSRLISLLIVATMVCAIVPISAQPAAAAPLVSVKIAVAAPLTAGSTTLGRNMQYGAQLAVADYAAQLASAGVEVTVTAHDDRGYWLAATNVANAIVGDTSVMGVVGHLDSRCSLPASKVYRTADLAMVTPMSTDPVVTQQGLTNVFRTCAVDTGQGTLGADLAVRNLRLKRAYIVDDSTKTGRYYLADGFGKRFIANGGKVVGRAHTSSTQINFRALSAKIKAKKPSVVYYGGSAKSGAHLLRRLRRIGVKAQYIGGSGLHNSTFLSTAARPYSEGVFATAVGLPNSQLYGGVAYESRFAAAFPGVASIDGDDAYAYDAAVAIIRGILGVVSEGGTSALESANARGRVRAKVAASDFYGVTGRVRFYGTGDRVSPQFSAWRAKAGVWSETASIGTPGVSESYEARHVDVLGTLTPKLPANTHTVWLRFYRKNTKKQYVWVRTVPAAVVDNLGDSRCTYEAFNVKLGKGSYFVFARHSGNGLASMDSPSRYFSVK